jgi:hypothetical protein
VPVRVALRRRGGGSRKLTVRVPVPADVRPGERTLVIEGNGFPDESDDLLLQLGSGLTGGRAAGPAAHASGVRTAAAEPRTPKSLARALAAYHRPLGIVAHFRHRHARVVLRSSDVRFDGQARVSLRVVRARR